MVLSNSWMVVEKEKRWIIWSFGTFEEEQTSTRLEFDYNLEKEQDKYTMDPG